MRGRSTALGGATGWLGMPQQGLRGDEGRWGCYKRCCDREYVRDSRTCWDEHALLDRELVPWRQQEGVWCTCAQSLAMTNGQPGQRRGMKCVT